MIPLIKRLVLSLFILCVMPLQAMRYSGNLEPAKPKSKSNKPQTLCEYFGLDPRFALPASRDVFSLISKKVHGDKQLWYPTISLRHTLAVSSVQYSSDGTQLITGCYDNQLRVFTEKCGESKRMLFNSPPKAFTFYPGTKKLILALENTPHVIDIEKNEIIGELSRTQSAIQNIVIDPHVRHLALSMFGTQVIYTLAPLTKRVEFKTGDNWVYPTAFHPNGYLAAVAVKEGVQLYDTSGGKPFETSNTQHIVSPHIRALTYNPQGTLLAAGCQDGHVRFFDMNCQEVGSFDSYKVQDRDIHVPVIQIAYNHTGSLLAFVTAHSIATGHNVYIWQEGCGKVANLGYSSSIQAIAFNPTKNALAVGGFDDSGSVCVWEQHALTCTQLLFRYVLKNYLLRSIAYNKKPGTPPSKSTQLFTKWMAEWFNLDKESLDATWRTFPDKLQAYIVTSYRARAKKIGYIESCIYDWRKIAEEKKRNPQKNNSLWGK